MNKKLWCCITPERHQKTRMMMTALAQGWDGDREVILGEPPPDGNAFAVWGQEWLTLRTVPKAAQKKRPYYHLDNGYYMPACGGRVGYYRVTYRSLSPILLRQVNWFRLKRIGEQMSPWRKNRGREVLIAMPGRHFGMALGIDVDGWIATICERVRKHSDRPLLIRRRDSTGPLEADLDRAWVLVTHSSNVAVDAARLGIPVIVEPTNPAAPVGSTNLANIENPVMPDRQHWWCSLMCQQYTLDDMRDGTAARLLGAVREQVDGQC